LPRVMIVDDDSTMVKLLQTLLELDGFDVSVVRQGADVLDKAIETPPDIFLMDYHLTDIDGVEVLRQIRANGKLAKTPVIIASGANVEEEVMAAGADDFLLKPYDPDDLPALFSQLID